MFLGNINFYKNRKHIRNAHAFYAIKFQNKFIFLQKSSTSMQGM